MTTFLDNARSRSQSIRVSTPRDGLFVSRAVAFALFCSFLIFAFWSQLVSLVDMALNTDYCTHILLIPFISTFLVCLDKKRIFQDFKSSYISGTLLLLVGAGLYWVAGHPRPSTLNDYLTRAVLSFVLLVVAGFILCFGGAASRKASFPLSFLLLMVPLPSAVLTSTIYFLQTGSTAIAYYLFHLLAVPVFRDHFTLQLPQFTIHIAKECSSIRSSLAFFITALLAANLFLRKRWTRVVLVAISVPLSVLKNGVRIVTLSVLAIRVDPRFLTGKLHQRGGILFYLLVLLILGVLLQALRWAEKPPRVTSLAGADRLEGREGQDSAHLSRI